MDWSETSRVDWTPCLQAINITLQVWGCDNQSLLLWFCPSLWLVHYSSSLTRVLSLSALSLILRSAQAVCRRRRATGSSFRMVHSSASKYQWHPAPLKILWCSSWSCITSFLCIKPENETSLCVLVALSFPGWSKQYNLDWSKRSIVFGAPLHGG